MHHIQCQCGTLHGAVQAGGTCNRLVCYCTDCRAFARFVGRDNVLDEQGGTEIVQLAQSRLRFTQGAEQLAAVRLSESGMIRWYAACCKTPLGNTMPDPKMSFIGLIHTSLARPQMDEDFGTTIALASTASALGEPKPQQRGMVGIILRFLWLLATERISGRYRQSPLFRVDGTPIVEARILSAAELQALKQAG